jgi:hypothetical protein
MAETIIREPSRVIFYEYGTSWWNKAFLVQAVTILYCSLFVWFFFDLFVLEGRSLAKITDVSSRYPWLPFTGRLLTVVCFSYMSPLLLLTMTTPSRMGVMFARYYNVCFGFAVFFFGSGLL